MRKRNDHQIRKSRKINICLDSGILLATKNKNKKCFSNYVFPIISQTPIQLIGHRGCNHFNSFLNKMKKNHLGSRFVFVKFEKIVRTCTMYITICPYFMNHIKNNNHR